MQQSSGKKKQQKFQQIYIIALSKQRSFSLLELAHFLQMTAKLPKYASFTNVATVFCQIKFNCD